MPTGGEQLVNATPAADVTSATVRIQLAQDTLRQFGFLRMRAMGGSMLPAIAAGDILDFRDCSQQRIEPGQVVLVRAHGRLVAHRLVAHGERMLTTRGDALAEADPAVPTEALLGVLVRQQRGAQTLHAGGRHWLRRQRAARWLIRRMNLVHKLFGRIPALTTLTA